ncbi:hypothetical protein DCF50_p1698 [Dehalobacter sp. CF]|nr:hypothetical protein DCF50_p1698 [Dehalobacter sp. CF]
MLAEATKKSPADCMATFKTNLSGFGGLAVIRIILEDP